MNVNKHRYIYVFHQLKHNVEIKWVSLNGARYGGIFSIYTTSFKSFKSVLFKVKCPKIDVVKPFFFFYFYNIPLNFLFTRKRNLTNSNPMSSTY